MHMIRGKKAGSAQPELISGALSPEVGTKKQYYFARRKCDGGVAARRGYELPTDF